MKPIQLNFKSSFLLSALIVGMSLGACFILVLLTLFLQIKLLLVLSVVILAAYAVCCYGLLLLPWSCVALSVNVKNQLQFIRKDGKQLEVLVQENSVVTPYLTVLNCKLSNRDQLDDMSLIMRRLLMLNLTKLSVTILPDALDPEGYRQLRVWLRWGHSSKLD